MRAPRRRSTTRMMTVRTASPSSQRNLPVAFLRFFSGGTPRVPPTFIICFHQRYAVHSVRGGIAGERASRKTETRECWLVRRWRQMERAPVQPQVRTRHRRPRGRRRSLRHPSRNTVRRCNTVQPLGAVKAQCTAAVAAAATAAGNARQTLNAGSGIEKQPASTIRASREYWRPAPRSAAFLSCSFFAQRHRSVRGNAACGRRYNQGTANPPQATPNRQAPFARDMSNQQASLYT